MNTFAEDTLDPMCNSWSFGANAPGKSRVLMPEVGFPAYVSECEEVVARGYEGLWWRLI